MRGDRRLRQRRAEHALDARRLARAHRAPASDRPIDLGARARRARSPTRLGLALRLPGHHRRRHQRQGLDLRDARGDPARRRLPGRPVHLAAPAALQRARAHRRRAGRRRGAGRRSSRRSRRARGDVVADLLRIHARWRSCGCSAARELDVVDARGRAGRAARCGQPRRRRLCDRHQRSTSITSIISGDTREQIGFEKAHIFRRRPAGDLRRSAAAAVAARACAGDRCRSVAASGAISTTRAIGSSGPTAAAQQRRSGLPYPALRGANQLLNAAGALAALEALRDRAAGQPAGGAPGAC